MVIDYLSKYFDLKAIYSDQTWGLLMTFELKLESIFDQLGRYLHRNALLGRKSTALELEFLATPNSSF